MNAEQPSARQKTAKSITYSLRQLLNPKSLWTRKALGDGLLQVPAQPGVYAWWFKKRPPGVPCRDAYRAGTKWLLYVGIAPSRATSSTRRTLKKRLKNHWQGRIACSTLRRSLACLLETELELRLRRRSGKLILAKAEEEILSEWMARNVAVSWIVHPEPWLVEDAILASKICLPLNIAGSSHSFANRLRALRVAAGRDR
jgi:hypothetical protein